jgi:uncharacterized protein (TIRG00374 family)
MGILLLVLAFRGIDFSRMVDGIRKANYAWIGIAIILMVAANLSRAYRWNMLIQPLGYSPKLSNTFWSVMAGYMANLALPRMGEITRCGSLNQTDKIPLDVLIGTVIVERTLDVLMLILSISLTAFLEYKLLGGFIYKNIVGPILIKISSLLSSATFLIFAILLLSSIIAIAVIIYNNRKRIALFNKLVLVMTGVWSGMATIFTMRKKWLFIAHTIFIWTMYYLMSYVCFFAIPATAQLGFTAGLFTLVLGGIGMTAPVQGGVGVYHLLVSQGLTLFGVSAPDGLLYATLVHTMQTIMMIILGSVGLLVIFMEKKKYISTYEAP